ncbi:DNA recombination protein RmuC [Pseudooceanicola sediminis]|uniref:DNA recombination protein RmuC homolog n=1 Tax=Pseudooceanicola sediminis TaxID=2211117 RepID=A0A399IWM1_9RHOB|nr:DNA recombination protein RmuC [Pseudooceanicola sediminis]KAA2312555.1 DNA recombination protein RmuC [Puniceibacterium sp. HSS470]RII37563.1 DNA recombination protein RmuC [Pseudooceanicola sediminis]|tara:strand:- start:26323 stop:27558 length:1236 start_codon:yes stop_codon:yes gene_type:complete
MIQIGSLTLDTSDPLTLVILGGAAGFVILLILLIFSLRAAARASDPLIWQMTQLSRHVEGLGRGQEQLAGNLSNVSNAQTTGQAQMLQSMEARLAHVQQQMNDRLHENAMRQARSLSEMQEKMNAQLRGGSENTVKSLSALQERLQTIDKAQENITKLSGDVLSLQDILSNKQTRGAFGEIQLNDIVSKALPPDSYTLQAKLSNDRRADCLIHLPNPPGPIVVDAKFPLEAYEALRRADTTEQKARAAQMFRQSVRHHIRAISDRYIIEGETADGALMFLPSEAVYAELHANFTDVVRESFNARVWIVSPTTCMATLNTMRAILKDARMREQAGAIRKTLHLLHRDVELVVERVGKLETHFDQARRDLDGIGTAAERAGKRALRLDNFDFEELTSEDATPLESLAQAPSNG